MRFRLALALIAAAAAICDIEPAAAQYGQYPVPFALGGVIGQMQQLQQQQYMLQQQQSLARQQAGAAWSQPAQTWYYCDPARTYYPYVATCPTPWRAVDPQQPQMQQPQEAARQREQQAANERREQQADRQRYVRAGAAPHTAGEYTKVLEECYDHVRSSTEELNNIADAAGIPRVNLDKYDSYCPHSAQIVVDCHSDIDCVDIERLAEEYVKKHGRTFVTPADRAIGACVLHRIDANPTEPWQDTQQACGSG